MGEKNSIEEINGYIRLALPLMSKHNIPITPKNYAVWFQYVSGSNGELTHAIDTLLGKRGLFTEERNESLYRQFCAENDENELRKIREDLQQILLTILREVTELTGQTQEYESLVSHSVNSLSEGASIQEVRAVINDIIDKTKKLGRFGKTIQHKLKETTKTLEVLKKDLEQAKAEIFLDFLTGVPNRKAFDETLSILISQARFGHKDLSLLLIDIDYFKKFNDQFGHLVGDQVLRFVAGKMKEIVRGRDFLSRFGGEEFAIVLPQTPLAGAQAVAESIRSFFAQTTLKAVGTSKPLGTITVSIGVARYRAAEEPESFLNRCDQALYFAKSKGRNRVEIESEAMPGQ